MSEPMPTPPMPALPPPPQAPPQAAPPTTAPAGSPAERRGLIAILTVIEAALLVIPLFSQSLFASPVEPVSDSGLPGCFQGGSGGVTVINGAAPCSGGAFDQTLTVLALLAVALGLLVMPVLIGYFSRRWQTALGAPSIPLWALTIVSAIITVLVRSSSFFGFVGNSPVDSYSVVFAVIFNTPLILMVLVAGGLGGLAWLAHRGFGR